MYSLVRFPGTVRFENQSILSGEEFLRGLFELFIGHKKMSVAENFGCHTSDRSRAFKYFINHIFDNFHELVENNLQLVGRLWSNGTRGGGY